MLEIRLSQKSSAKIGAQLQLTVNLVQQLWHGWCVIMRKVNKFGGFNNKRNGFIWFSLWILMEFSHFSSFFYLWKKKESRRFLLSFFPGKIQVSNFWVAIGWVRDFSTSSSAVKCNAKCQFFSLNINLFAW